MDYAAKFIRESYAPYLRYFLPSYIPYILISEGRNYLYRQASNGHFRLPLASNWLKYYRESSKYPNRDSLHVLNNYRYFLFVHFIVMHQKFSLSDILDYTIAYITMSFHLFHCCIYIYVTLKSCWLPPAVVFPMVGL